MIVCGVCGEPHIGEESFKRCNLCRTIFCCGSKLIDHVSDKHKEILDLFNRGDEAKNVLPFIRRTK